MISDIKIREPNAGKRKRIPLDPALKQRNTKTQETTKPTAQGQKQYHDSDPDMVIHYRINARLEEDQRRVGFPQRGNV